MYYNEQGGNEAVKKKLGWRSKRKLTQEGDGGPRQVVQAYNKHHTDSRRLGSKLLDYIDNSLCFVANFVVVPQAQKNLWHFEKVIPVGPVPCTVSVDLNVNYQMVLNTLLCIADQALVLNLEPTAGLEVVIFGGVALGFFKVGLQATFWVMRPTLSAEASYTTKWLADTCRALDLTILPFMIKVEFVLEFLICLGFEQVRGALHTLC